VGQPAGALLSVRLAEGAADVRLTRVPGHARVLVRNGDDAGAPFAFAVQDVRVGGVPVPDFLVSWLARHFDPTPRLRSLPVPVSLGAIHIQPGLLQVGPAWP
jgi:hypothetical protein